MKLLLDMYKGYSKDQRDKVQLMATEKKLRSEIDEMRNQMKKIQVNMICIPKKLKWVLNDSTGERKVLSRTNFPVQP